MYARPLLVAAVPYESNETADFFRILQAGANDVSVIFYRDGKEIARAENVGAGYAEEFPEPFTKIIVTSIGGQQVAFSTRLGSRIKYDAPPTGAMTLSGQQGAFTQAAVATSVASVQILAAKASRRYLLIQNLDAANAVHINLAGAAAAIASGMKIAAGGSFVADVFCPTAAISAIAAAGTPNLVVIEG